MNPSNPNHHPPTTSVGIRTGPSNMLAERVIRSRYPAAYRVKDIADDSEHPVVRRINDWITKRRKTIAIVFVGPWVECFSPPVDVTTWLAMRRSAACPPGAFQPHGLRHRGRTGDAAAKPSSAPTNSSGPLRA
jgi:hypothetical protein